MGGIPQNTLHSPFQKFRERGLPYTYFQLVNCSIKEKRHFFINHLTKKIKLTENSKILVDKGTSVYENSTQWSCESFDIGGLI